VNLISISWHNAGSQNNLADLLYGNGAHVKTDVTINYITFDNQTNSTIYDIIVVHIAASSTTGVIN